MAICRVAPAVIPVPHTPFLFTTHPLALHALQLTFPINNRLNNPLSTPICSTVAFLQANGQTKPRSRALRCSYRSQRHSRSNQMTADPSAQLVDHVEDHPRFMEILSKGLAEEV